MRHKERIQIIEEIIKKLVHKYKKEVILGGVYGSVANDTDAEYSDIDLLFIVENASRAKSFNFRYKNIVVNSHIQKIKDAKKEIKDVDLSWPFKMGGMFNIKVLYGNKNFLDKLEKEARSISNSKISKFVKRFGEEYIYSIFEAFDKLKSLKERKGYHEKKILIFDILIMMMMFIAIINKEFLCGNYYSIINNIHKFKKLPEDFQGLSQKIIQNEDIDEIVHSSNILMDNFIEFFKNNGGKFQEVKLLEEIKIF